MNVRKLFVPVFIAAVGLAAVVGSVAIADTSKDPSAGGLPEIPLPPGWTMEDMQDCMLAGTPGEMHERLANDVGVWHGKTMMWMAPGTEPIESECTATTSSMMDGRYTKMEWEGEMPGMGPYHGFGINGFDNVSQKFVAIWLDNHSTGIMNGVGKLSDDGKTLTWKFTHNCPLTKKPVVMRQIDTLTGPNKKSIERCLAPTPRAGRSTR